MVASIAANKAVSRWLFHVAILLLIGQGCAFQDDLVVVNQRLTALNRRVSGQEKTLQTLRSEISKCHEDEAKSEEAFRDKHADLRALVNDLREEIQALRGDMEEMGHTARHEMATLSESESERSKRWETLQQTVRSSLDRIVRLEEYLGMEPSEKLPVGATEGANLGEKQPTQVSADVLYAQAKGQFDKGQYEDARTMFATFVKKYPKSDNADNAQFWMGEIYYREKWYEKAILEYQKVIEKYPKGNKVSSALLKQGFAFLNLGDEDNARLILKELARKYPKSNEANIAKKKLGTLQ